MRVTLILSFFLVFSTFAQAAPDSALRRSNKLLRFIAENAAARNFALGTLINTRCSRYMPFGEVGDCQRAVKKMIELLDFDVILAPDDALFRPQEADSDWAPSAFVFVAFREDFVALLSSSLTARYLSDLNQELYKFLTNDRGPLNILEFTKRYYKTDLAAARAIAALFQDTSKMKLHLGYLEVARIRGNQNFVSNKLLLSRVIDTVNLVLNASEDSFRELFYPKEVAKNVNRNIYHYYVPLYLSMALASQGVHERYAFAAAFMLTLSYEFITAGKDYRNLYSDPKQLDPSNPAELWKLKDIYGGYTGASYGVWGGNFYNHFDVIKESFARSSYDGVDLLLNN